MAFFSREVQWCGSTHGGGYIWIDARVREENLNAAVHAIHRRGVQWRVSTRVGQVRIDPLVSEEKCDAAYPAMVCRDEQRRLSALRFSKIRVDTGVGQEKLDVAAPSKAALWKKHGLPRTVRCIHVSPLHPEGQLHGVRVVWFASTAEGKSKRSQSA